MSTGRGGVSGGPLTQLTPGIVAEVRSTVGDLPVVACGGIFTPDDVRAALDAGASAVQVYTGLIYAGPALPGILTQGIAAGVPTRHA